MLTQLANVLWNRCKDEEAIKYADRAKEISPTYPLLNFTRGRILWSLERYDESIKEWNIILSMPENLISQTGYGGKWAKSIINDARYYKADCLYHIFKDKEALALMDEHLAHRKRGIESDFSKKEAILFFKQLKYSHPKKMTRITDEGYASDMQRDKILKKMDSLERNKDWKGIIHYLKKTIALYPNEYYLMTILSEYCNILENKKESLEYAKRAFDLEPYDPLVKYNYGNSLLLNGQKVEALAQFKEMIDLGLDYLAYSEHGEGLRWAKKMMQKAQQKILEITKIKA